MAKYGFLKYQDLIFVVENPPIDPETAAYMYEEKLCPHDVFRMVVEVIDTRDGDKDPHGIFEYLGQSDGKDNSEPQLALIAYEYLTQINADRPTS